MIFLKYVVAPSAFGLALTLIVVSGSAEVIEVKHETVALTGDAAAGVDGGVFEYFNAPVINSRGQVAFSASITGPGIGPNEYNNQGIWSEASGSSGQPGLVARKRPAVLGTDDFTFGSLQDPYLSDTGYTVFEAAIDDPSVNYWQNYNVLSEAAGTRGMPQFVIRTGYPSSDPVGATQSGIIDMRVNAQGQTAVTSGIYGTGVTLDNNLGVWSEAAGATGSPKLIAREGSTAAGTSGAHFSAFDNLVLNDHGQTAFRADLIGTGVDDTNNSGIFSEAAGAIGSPELVVRKGSTAPGTGGALFDDFNHLSINNAGQTAFVGTLTGPDIEFTNGSGIWAGAADNRRLVARRGSVAAGTGGETFLGTSRPVINGAGLVAFVGALNLTSDTGGTVDTSNYQGIWSETVGDIGSPGLIARGGMDAPGFSNSKFYGFGDPIMNRSGWIAFEASVRSSSSSTDAGIWVAAPDGTLTMVIREGGRIDVDNDPLTESFRTVQAFVLHGGSGGQDGQHAAFNDAGQLTFSVLFTNGTSGVFVATVPEPTTVAFIAMFAPLVMHHRRRYARR